MNGRETLSLQSIFLPEQFLEKYDACFVQNMAGNAFSAEDNLKFSMVLMLFASQLSLAKQELAAQTIPRSISIIGCSSARQVVSRQSPHKRLRIDWASLSGVQSF